MNTATDETYSAETYTEFLRGLELNQVAVVQSSFWIRRDDYFEEEDTTNTAQATYKPLTIGERFFDIQATLRLRVYSPKTRRTLIRFRVMYEMHFHAKPPIERRLVELFSRSDIRVLIWPFFREYVTNATARMHIPPVILPLSGE
jgi:hypothetical protein